MKTKLSIKQKLILAAFIVCILAVKIVAFYYTLKTIDSKAGVEFHIIGAFYYPLMLSLMAYLGYIGKGLKAISIIFAVELFLVLISVLLSEFCSLSSAGLIYGFLVALYIFVVGSHGTLYATFDLEFWQFFLLLIFVYAVFLAVGLISNKALKRLKMKPLSIEIN